MVGPKQISRSILKSSSKACRPMSYTRSLARTPPDFTAWST